MIAIEAGEMLDPAYLTLGTIKQEIDRLINDCGEFAYVEKSEDRGMLQYIVMVNLLESDKQYDNRINDERAYFERRRREYEHMKKEFE